MKNLINYLLLASFILVLSINQLYADNLDTTGDAAYLSQLEKEVIIELNKVRTNPKDYAEKYIKTNTMYNKADVKDCYNELIKTKALDLLYPSYGLYLTVKDLVKDQSATGGVGHETSKGEDPSARMAKYGKWVKTCGENVSYGCATATEIVVQLLVDEGVPSRGHRRNILEANYKKVGISCGKHPEYDYMCAQEFAYDFTDKYKYSGSNNNTKTEPVKPVKPVEPTKTTNNDTSNSSIDTTKGVDYLNQLEKEVVIELNKVRTDPKAYAEKYIKTNTMYKKADVLDCYKELIKTKPMSILTPSRGMSYAVRVLANDQAESGDVGHETSKGEDPSTRLNMYGKWIKTYGENVSYGFNNATDIVVQLLVDEGVPSRGHRRNILNTQFNKVGISCAEHAEYRYMCAQTFAYDYTDYTKEDNSSDKKNGNDNTNYKNTNTTPDVIVYGSPQCGYCVETVNELKKNKINYVFYDIDTDENKQNEAWGKLLKKYPNTEYVNFPIVDVKGDIMIRPSIKKIVKKLKKSKK